MTSVLTVSLDLSKTRRILAVFWSARQCAGEPSADGGAKPQASPAGAQCAFDA